MKLVFYSGGQSRKNKALHQALSELSGPSRRKTFTYVPFCTDGSEPYFSKAVRRYKPYGFAHFNFFPVDQRLQSEALKRALGSEVIYLAGGNTFYFLNYLRKSGLLGKLSAYVKSGGVLAGLSAGGLIMTPSIALAGYPAWEADKNDIQLKNLKGLGLVSFEFYPHFKRSPRLKAALSQYSRNHKTPILTAEDGGGVVVNGKMTTLLGKINLLADGEFYEMSSR